MKTLLTTLSMFTLATSSVTFSSAINTTFQNSKLITNNQQLNHQDTIYLDKNGNKVTTNKVNLSEIDTKEIIQIGFFQNQINRNTSCQNAKNHWKSTNSVTISNHIIKKYVHCCQQI